VKRYLLRLAYNGGSYAGWQIQQNAVTVQSVLDKALSVFLRVGICTVGCGRTDTGVHAREFFAHFDFEGEIADCNLFLTGINAILPHDIAVYELFEVADNFNARFSAVSRSYEYVISTKKNPFLKGFSKQVFKNPDLAKMNDACLYLIGKQDFTSFSKVNTQVKTNICNVFSAKWSAGNDTITFQISADRFLRGMVRAIVGTCLMIGNSDQSPDEMKRILSLKNRSFAGEAVDPSGLFLTKVEYPPNNYNSMSSKNE